MVSPALIIVHRDAAGATQSVPFVYRDGRLLEVVEEIANYRMAMAPEGLWEGIAADRQRIILDQRVKLQDALVTVNRQQAAIEKLKTLTGMAMEEAAS